MESSVLIALGTAAFCGGFVQGFVGFGHTLVALPFLVQAVALRQATPVCCLLAVVVNIVLVARLHGHIRWRAVGLLLVASLPGMGLGAYLLRVVNGEWLKAALGLAVLVFVVHAVLCRSGSQARAGWRSGLVAGFVAGSMGAAIGVNGPPAVAWVSHRGYDRNAMRATLTAYFLLAGIGVTTSQFLAGLVTPQVLTLTGLGLPAVLTGLVAGMAGCGRLGEWGFARVVLGVLTVVGLGLLAEGAWGVWAG